MKIQLLPRRWNPHKHIGQTYKANIGSRLGYGNTVRVIGRGQMQPTVSQERMKEEQSQEEGQAKPAKGAMRETECAVENPVEKPVEKIVEAEKPAETMTEKVEPSVTLPEMPMAAPVEEAKEAETAEELETPEPYLDEELYLDGVKEGGETSGELVAPETVEVKTENGGVGRKGKRRGKKHRKNR